MEKFQPEDRHKYLEFHEARRVPPEQLTEYRQFLAQQAHERTQQMKMNMNRMIQSQSQQNVSSDDSQPSAVTSRSQQQQHTTTLQR